MKAASMALMMLSFAAWTQAADLHIKIGSTERIFKQSELLQSPAARTLRLDKVWAYKDISLSVTAVPVFELFKGIERPNTVLQFKALDGFAGFISKERLLNADLDQH